MSDARWREVDRILDLALDQSPDEWPTLLDRECAGDAILRRELEALLAGHGRGPSLLDAGVDAVAAAALRDIDARTIDPLIDARLGPWQIVREVGRGGMSRVYEAHRIDGVFSQRVAIKVLRAGLDTETDTRRFHAERQILASLDHPYIARLLDGGVTADGRPYVVLEYIDGVPLTEWCRERGLDIPARLRLMLSVAEATQSAHRRLVVHRDLKPTNILVATDGKPRLLDFGIAKVLEATDAVGDATGTQHRWLSPAYAAPEQFSGGAVTTATDVYQLGAVLYEVLSGQRPFTEDRRTTDRDPEPPSRHAPALRGDLDAIVLKAMRVEPDARYASVADFAADITRVLDGEPVTARIGERSYRWRRTVRRRLVPLSIAASAFAVTVGYAVTLSVQTRRIERALRDATMQKARAEQVTGFLRGLFESNDPRSGSSDTVSARTLLARGEAQAMALGAQPELQAELLTTIGQVRSALGAHREARGNLERAIAVRRRLQGDTSADVLRTRMALAIVDQAEGRFDAALATYRDGLRYYAARGDDTSSDAREARFSLAVTLHSAGQFAASDTAFDAWEASLERASPARDLHLAAQLVHLGEVRQQGRVRDTSMRTRADRHYRDALAIQVALLGPSHVEVGSTMGRYGFLRTVRGDHAGADSMLKAATAILSAAYPRGHPELAQVLLARGNALSEVGRYDEAIEFYRRARDMARESYGADNVLVLGYLGNLANGLTLAHRWAEAEQVYKESMRGLLALGNAGASMSRFNQVRLAMVLLELGKQRDAEAELLAAYAWLAERRGMKNRQTQFALRMLDSLYRRVGKPDVAARYRALGVTSDAPPTQSVTPR